MQLQFNLLKSCLLFLLLFSSSKVYTFAPSTIGDFVWYDSNNNGIQDAGEPQLNGVRVFLYEQTNPGVFTIIGQTTTNASGVYRFDASNSIPLQNNTTYYIVLPDPILQPGTFNPTTVTIRDAGPLSINQDNVDSDASIALAPLPFAGMAYIPFTTTAGTAPISNYDFGFFTLCSNFNVTLGLVDEVCQGETIRLTANATGGQGTLGYDWSDGFSAPDNFHDVKPAIDIRYTVTVTDGVGCTATNFVDVQVRRCKLDLALKKTIRQDTAYKVNDIATFDITVCNQGETIVDSIILRDHIPNGYVLVDPDWIINSSTSTFVTASYLMTESNGRLIGKLPPGACVTVPIDLRLVVGANRNNLVNFAEIYVQRDIYGFEDDFDSTPGSNSALELSVKPNDTNDDNLLTNGPAMNEDQDDHDPSQAPFFDLALKKISTSGKGPFKYDENVTFNVIVFNQGNVTASDIVVSDYVPSGFVYQPNNSPPWSYDATSSIATTIITGNLMPGDSIILPIVFKVKPTSNVNGWLNNAEIFSAEDKFGDSRTRFDADSTPDNILGNDVGGTPDTALDNLISDDGLDSDGDGLRDEDDHDSELIKVFDLALKKTLLTSSPFAYNQDLIFQIMVCNQGNIVAKNVEISDYIPAGYEYMSTANAALGWVFSGSGVSNLRMTQIAPGQCETRTIVLKLKNGIGLKNWDNYAEITKAEDTNGVDLTSFDADSTPGSNSNTENQVRPGSPDDDNLNGRGVIYNEDEDDHDPAGPQFYDVALKMTTTAVGPFSVGQIVKFDINISNQGNLPIKNIEFVDYIPDGLEYVGVQNFTKWTYDVFSGYAISKIRQTLNPGQSAQTSIYLKIKYSTNYAFGWDNRAEIYSFEDTAGNDVTSMDIDSTPDGIIGNDGGGEPKGPSDDSTNGDASGPINGGPATGDEDDEDPERIEIFDLALKKELFTAGPYKYGQKLTFNIKVCNQGNIGATNIDVRNYIPLGFSFSLADNPLWTAWPTYTISSIVQPNTCFDIPLVLSVTQTDGGEKDWVSYAEIAAADNKDGLNRDFWDIDSSPNSNNVVENAVKPNDVSDNYIDGHDKGGEEDDHDPAGAKIFDLAIRKIQLTALPSFSYGQQVQFGISIFNQGNIDAKDIIIIDTLACGLEYISTPANTAQGWVYNPATREVRSTYNNVLIAGANVQLTLDVKVISCYTNPDKAWTNSIEIQSANDNDPNTSYLPVDSDSTPDNNNSNDPGGLPNGMSDNEINGDPNNPNNPGAPQDEDDQDPHKIQLFDLALRKTVDFIGPYRIGETATFRIKIYNQGNVPAQNVVINDYIRSGFAFNAAANPGWTMTTAPTSSFDGLLNYTITSVLLPGDSIILPLLLEIALDENPAVKDWWNYAEIRSAQDLFGNTRNDDADSTPNTNSLYENTVEPDGPRDNVINGNGPNFNQDEDDHDPEKVIVVGGLGDTVWKDTDGDGKQDPGEFGVANVIATLTDCRGNVIQTTTTDATGFYFFKNLIPGDYQVQFDIKNLPKGCAFTFQNQGPDVSKDSDVNINGLGPCTNITGGEYDSTYDAGLLILAAIGDFVWHDVNGDGQQGLGEEGIAGMQVKLFKEDGTFVANKFTDVNGNYLFDFLYPGYYYLEFIDSSGLESTFYNIGNDRTDSDVDNSNGLRTTSLTYLAPGERDMTWDAGYYICVPIGDLVWYDINKNDVWDTDENGVNGLVVNLWRNHFGAWIIWQTKYSGFKPGTPSDDGYFKFCAPPGQYYVQVVMPPLGLVRARPNIGTNEENDSDVTNENGQGTTASFTLLSGQEKCDLGAGYYPMAVAGNLVWRDDNQDGVQNENEPKVSGVVVQAFNAQTNTKVAEAITDEEGKYTLDYLEKGDIYVKFQVPAGYSATAARAAADNVDSDVDHSYGPNTTRMFAMSSGMVNENIDLGIAFGVLPVEWLDVDANRVNNTHVVTWRTAKEVNVDYYVVERRLATENVFTQIPGKVAASTAASTVHAYSHIDSDVATSGVYIYRVKQVDFDGKFTYSKLVSLSHQGDNTIELYPNPARNDANIQIVLSDDAEVKVEMYDASSKLVKVIKSSNIQLAGNMIYNANLSDVQAGVYNVIVTIDGVQTQKKLIRIE